MEQINNTRAEALIAKLVNKVDELGTELAKSYTAYGWDSPKMGAENYGGMMPQIVLGHAAAHDSRIVIMGDTLFIYDASEGIYYPFEEEVMEPLTVAIAKKLGFKVEAFYGSKFDSAFIKELSKRAAMSRIIGRYAKPAQGIQFTDGWVSLSKKGEVTFDEGFDDRRMATFRVNLAWKATKVRESNAWNHILRYQGFSDERIEYINAMIGNAIMGDPTKAERCLMLVGVGGTGKSTILDTIGKAVGSHNRHDVDSLDQLTGSNGRHVAGMGHSVITVVADSSADFRNKEMLKKIITKEAVAVEMKYKNPEPIVPRSSLLLASNDSGIAYQMGDTGIGRRFDIIKFNKFVTKEVKNNSIGDELEADLDMLCMIWVKALVKFTQRHGKFARPAWMEAEMRDEATEADPLLGALSGLGLSVTEPVGGGSSKSVIYIRSKVICTAVADAMLDAGENVATTGLRKVGNRLTNLGAVGQGKKNGKVGQWRRFYIENAEALAEANFDKNLVSTVKPLGV